MSGNNATAVANGRVVLNKYQVTRKLGEGGMGVVYLAKDRAGRLVVLKVMHEHIAQEAKFRANFEREMQFMARLRHPNAVALYEASADERQGMCIVMEYIPGITLESLLKRHRRLDTARAGRILGQLCMALDAAHGLGIVHRDLKPVNLMVVNPDAADESLKVMDFGLAQLSSALYIAAERLRNPADYYAACGTPDYISPEQVRGDEADHRADLYSVGVILYQMLTGRLPFRGAETRDVLLAHVNTPPPRFSQHGVADVSPDVEAVVRACLSKFPNERPQSARELAENYERAAGGKPIFDRRQSAAPPDAAPADDEPADPDDPHAVVEHVEAWMPESIAVLKVRGFVQDNGGEVVASEPGLLRVRFPVAAAEAESGGSIWGRLGLGRKPEPKPVKALEVQLRMKKKPPPNQGQLLITAVLRREGGGPLAGDPDLQDRCSKAIRDLKAYFIGNR